MRASIGSLLVLLAAGCGGEVEIDLVRASFDSPFQGLDRLRVSVLDSAGALLTERDLDPLAPDWRVPGLDPGSGRVVLVEGLAAGELRARGESGPLTLAAAETRRAPVPFATLPVAIALPISSIASGVVHVDGRLDEWANAPVAAVLGARNAVIGQPRNMADLSARVQLAWGADGVYVAVRVLDDCVLCDPLYPDMIIVSWDGRGDREPNYYGPDDGYVTVGPSLIEAPAHVVAGVALLPGGYTVEVRIGWEALGVPAARGELRMGLEIEIFDGRGGAYQVVEAWVPSPDPLDRRPFPAEMGTLAVETWP